jgi:hypothetical protein
MGGSITGEHGVGVEKLEYLPVMYNTDEVVCMMRLRDAFDPLRIANPGKKFPRVARCVAEPFIGIAEQASETKGATSSAPQPGRGRG